MPQPAYPILLDLADRRILIVGGGPVAVRKARGLLDSGATCVVCISPAFDAGMPAEVVRIAERYEPRHLAGAGLVFACTDRPEVNDAIVRDAHMMGLWVNRADTDEDQPGDFTVPARLREGPVTITISAGSPALAAMIRNGLAERWDPRWTAMAEAMQVLRPAVLASGAPPEARTAAFRALASDEALEVVGTRGIEELKAWMRRKHPEVKI